MHEPFDDPQSDFPTERASLNIQASKSNLARFITSELNPIEVHLCHGDQSIGSAMVNFAKRFDNKLNMANMDIEPLVVSGGWTKIRRKKMISKFFPALVKSWNYGFCCENFSRFNYIIGTKPIYFKKIGWKKRFKLKKK